MSEACPLLLLTYLILVCFLEITLFQALSYYLNTMYSSSFIQAYLCHLKSKSRTVCCIRNCRHTASTNQSPSTRRRILSRFLPTPRTLQNHYQHFLSKATFSQSIINQGKPWLLFLITLAYWYKFTPLIENGLVAVPLAIQNNQVILIWLFNHSHCPARNTAPNADNHSTHIQHHTNIIIT